MLWWYLAATSTQRTLQYSRGSYTPIPGSAFTACFGLLHVSVFLFANCATGNLTEVCARASQALLSDHVVLVSICNCLKSVCECAAISFVAHHTKKEKKRQMAAHSHERQSPLLVFFRGWVLLCQTDYKRSLFLFFQNLYISVSLPVISQPYVYLKVWQNKHSEIIDDKLPQGFLQRFCPLNLISKRLLLTAWFCQGTKTSVNFWARVSCTFKGKWFISSSTFCFWTSEIKHCIFQISHASHGAANSLWCYFMSLLKGDIFTFSLFRFFNCLCFDFSDDML